MFKSYWRQTAFTLVELAIATGVMAILAGSVFPLIVRSIEIKAGEKTALEMIMIQNACRNYSTDHHVWPSSLSMLVNEGYLNPKWTGLNPWQREYVMSSSTKQLMVSTSVPFDLAKMVASRLTGVDISDGASEDLKVISTAISSTPSNLEPIGSIMPWPATSIPQGYLICDGKMLHISDYPELFAVLGTMYGGDGIDTFALPDIRGRAIVGQDNMGGNDAHRIDSWPQAKIIGGVFGEEQHKLTIDEMPSHNHGYMATPWTGARYDGHSSPLMTSQVHGQTENTGGDQPHNIIQPSIALVYIIKSG